MAEHGTRTMYSHYKCRCDACCRAEHAQYLKRKEAQKRTRVQSKWERDGSDTTPRRLITQRNHNRKRYAEMVATTLTHTRKISWREIAERDGMNCALCGNKTDPGDIWYTNGHKCYGRNYPTVDHIVPLVNGGTHTLDNMQLTCKRCNSTKGRNQKWVYSEQKTG